MNCCNEMERAGRCWNCKYGLQMGQSVTAASREVYCTLEGSGLGCYTRMFTGENTSANVWQLYIYFDRRYEMPSLI